MINVSIVSQKNYDGQRFETLKGAIVIIEKVINSEIFKQEVLNYNTNGEKTFSFKKNAFKSFEHYSNEEVFGMIMQAQETVGNISDGVIDLYLELIESKAKSAIGFGHPGDLTIYTYSGWFDNNDEKSIANHLTHEWCHKIGFDHAFYNWQDKNREQSVPYGIGNLIEELAEKI